MPRVDMIKFPVLLFLLVFFVTDVSAASETGNIQFKVRSVTFDGVKDVKKEDLVASLSVKERSVWKFWESSQSVMPQELKDDVLRIRQFYQARGYYQTTVSFDKKPVTHHFGTTRQKDPKGPPDAGVSGKPDIDIEYDVVFHIIEGPPVIIRQINFNCLCDIETESTKQLEKHLLFKPGDIFDSDHYDGSKRVVKKILGNKGYPFATIKGSARVDLNDHKVDIMFDVDPGPLYYFGKIFVSGNKGYVREKFIRRTITFKTGELYSDRKLDESRRNLFDLSIFKTAVISLGEPEKENKTLPVHIQVKKRKQQSVKLGIGYGTEDGVRLKGAWSYRNLTGRADKISLSAMRSDLIENVQGEYLVPYFLSAKNNLIAKSGFEREKSDYYTLRKVFSEVSVNRKLGSNWFSTIGYNLEINRPEDIKVDEDDDVLDDINQEDYRISSVKFDVEYNTVEDALNPKKGYVISFSFEDASGILGSEVDYIKPVVEAKTYFPLPFDTVLALRARFRTIKETEDTDYIPIYKQLFLGGSKTVRGYGYQELGVVKDGDVVTGVSGLSSFNANVEFRYPIYNDFSGVVFFDTGELDSESYRYNFNNLRYSCGAGLRYQTIIGPLQFDVGYKLNPAKSAISDDPELVDLADSDRWQFHLNIGQTF